MLIDEEGDDLDHPHHGHTDAKLFGKHNGRIYEEDRLHINLDETIKDD